MSMPPHVSMFSSSAIITGGTFTQNIHGGPLEPTKTSKELLLESTAHNAFHNSGERRDPPKCHHNTRVAILEEIMLWILTCNPLLDTLIMWLYGPAGAGKSAIAQGIADICFDQNLLLASFFFSRFDPTRNHARWLISSISYQISNYLPTTHNCIVENIDRDPLIFTRSLEAQILSLILDPLRPLIDSGYFKELSSRRLILIDGLDECTDRSEQVQIIKAVSTTLQKHNLPLLFFIASRPEHDIMSAFRSDPLQKMTSLLPLDDGYQAYADIELFLRDKITELKATHPLKSRIPSNWPGNDVIHQIVTRSSGQFIYTSTVLKYISSSRHHPIGRLDIVLGIRPANHGMPFAELDALYTHIFSSLDDPNPALRVLAFQMLSETKYVDHVGHMEEILSLNPGETDLILCDLGSILKVTDHSTIAGVEERRLQIFHASLEDFLLDESRSGIFHIDASTRHAEFALLYMQHLTDTPDALKIGSLVDLNSHIKQALPTEVLHDEIIKFTGDVLAGEGVKNGSHNHNNDADNLVINTNDLLDFLKAVVQSGFNDAKSLFRHLQRLLDLYVVERSYEEFIRAPNNMTWLSEPSPILWASDPDALSYRPSFDERI